MKRTKDHDRTSLSLHHCMLATAVTAVTAGFAAARPAEGGTPTIIVDPIGAPGDDAGSLPDAAAGESAFGEAAVTAAPPMPGAALGNVTLPFEPIGSGTEGDGPAAAESAAHAGAAGPAGTQHAEPAPQGDVAAASGAKSAVADGAVQAAGPGIGPGTGGPLEPAEPDGFGGVSKTAALGPASILSADAPSDPFRRHRLEASVLLSDGVSLSIDALSTIAADGTFLVEGVTYGAGGVSHEVVATDLATSLGTRLAHLEGERYAGYDARGEIVAEVLLWSHPRLGNDPSQRWTGRARFLDGGAVTQFSLQASGDFVATGAAQLALEQLWAIKAETVDDDDPFHPVLPVACYRLLQQCEGDGYVVVLPGILGLTPPCEVVCESGDGKAGTAATAPKTK